MQMTEIATLVRLCVGAVGTFFAILLWARTRDVAWVLVVTGVLLSYAAIIIDTLARFELLAWESQIVLGIPAGQLAHLALDNTPTVLYCAAFAVVLARHRLR